MFLFHILVMGEDLPDGTVLAKNTGIKIQFFRFRLAFTIYRLFLEKYKIEIEHI